MVDMKKKATEILEDYSNSYSQVDLETLTKFLEQINAEAVKEFAEIILVNYPEVDDFLDNLLKETVGDEK
jgi:hypothetical protein